MKGECGRKTPNFYHKERTGSEEELDAAEGVIVLYFDPDYSSSGTGQRSIPFGR